MSPLLVVGLGITAALAWKSHQNQLPKGRGLPADDPGHPLVPVYQNGKVTNRFAQYNIYDIGLAEQAKIGPRYPSLYNADLGMWVWQNPNATVKPSKPPVIA